MTAVNSKIGIPGYQGVVTDKNTIPAPETISTGTFNHTNGQTVVTGTDTKFKRDLQEGQYLYANDRIRKIVRIETDTRLIIESTFGDDLTDEEIKMCRPAIYRNVRIKNTHESAAAKVLNIDLPAGEELPFHCDAGLDPISYDATGSGLLIQTME